MLKRAHLMLMPWAMVLILTVGATSTYGQDPGGWEAPDAVLVGRVSHIEGELMRYDASCDHWTPTPRESPFGADDRLQSGVESKAEFIFPNNMWVRIDADTQIQLVTVDPTLSALDLPVGNARFINRSTHGKIKSTTPFGHVTAKSGAVFDLYVRENGVEVVAVKGSVYFRHPKVTGPMEVRSDSSALFADISGVTTTPGDMKHAWNNWNAGMNAKWAARTRAKGVSASYLPQALHCEAHSLDRHGTWENVYYENADRHFWRPVHVPPGWAPFTAGAWMVWRGDHVWIPQESFGYVTHHYGNWIFTAGCWYWAPPVTRVTIRAHRSLLRIDFGWYPGRVAWIHSGAHLGWIPLAPNEPYYTHRHWGRRSIVVQRGMKYHRHGPRRYKHRRHAVVIHRSHMYRTSSYRHSRVKTIGHKATVKTFQTTPVLKADQVKDPPSRRNKDRIGTTRNFQKSKVQRYTRKNSHTHRAPRNTRRHKTVKPSRHGRQTSRVSPIPRHRKPVPPPRSRTYHSPGPLDHHGAVKQDQRMKAAGQKRWSGSSDHRLRSRVDRRGGHQRHR
jgi:hypothetical protein